MATRHVALAVPSVQQSVSDPGSLRPASPSPSIISNRSETQARNDPQAYTNRKLDEHEKLGRGCVPSRSRADIDDTSPRSPWAKKTILSLDGGGIKGFSSLLILKYMVALIEDIEAGVRPHSYGRRDVYKGGPNKPCLSTNRLSHVTSRDSILPTYDYRTTYSEDCPWNPSDPPIDDSSTNGSAQVAGDQSTDLKAQVKAVLESDKSCHIRLHHYFDYVAGTSTGGLSAIMLGRMEMSINDALEQYNVFGNRIFGKPRPLHPQVHWFDLIQPKYPSKTMEKVLISVVSKALRQELSIYTNLIRDFDLPKPEEHEERILDKARKAVFQSDEGRCRTMVVSYGPTTAEPEVTRAYLFRTYNHSHPTGTHKVTKHKHLNPGKAHRDPIWEVARATSAAAPYFSPIRIRGRDFEDGAVVANNPAEIALTEVEQMHDTRPFLLLTLGTGRAKSMETYKKGGRRKGYISHWTSEIDRIKKVLTQSQQTAENVELRCHEKDQREIKHYRLNVEEEIGAIGLDAWQPPNSGDATKATIQEHTVAYIARKEIHDQLLSCAQELVRLRRERAMTERWETFARRYNYVCRHQGCFYPMTASKIFPTRTELRDHLIYQHQMIVSVGVEVMDGGSENCPKLDYVCTFDKCALRLVAFASEASYKDHLNGCHDFANPEFLSATRMEAWLDWSRIREVDAMKDYRIPSNEKENNRTAVNDTAGVSATTLGKPKTSSQANGHFTIAENGHADPPRGRPMTGSTMSGVISANNHAVNGTSQKTQQASHQGGSRSLATRPNFRGRCSKAWRALMDSETRPQPEV